MRPVVSNPDKPRRIMLYTGLGWLVSTLVITALPDVIAALSMMIFPLLTIPFAFLVAWYIPGKDTSNWVDIPIKWAIWFAAGLSLFFSQMESGMKSWTLADDIIIGIECGFMLMVASLPVYGIAYLVMHHLRTFKMLEIHCRQCGYDLTGNESGKCPECGKPLDFADRQLLKRKKAQSADESTEHTEDSEET